MKLVKPVLPVELEVRPVLDEAGEFLHQSLAGRTGIGLSKDLPPQGEHGVHRRLLVCYLCPEVLDIGVCGGMREGVARRCGNMRYCVARRCGNMRYCVARRCGDMREGVATCGRGCDKEVWQHEGGDVARRCGSMREGM